MDPILDLAEFGRRCRAARILVGYDSVQDAARELEQRTGVRISARTLGAIERGHQMPNAEQFIALYSCYQPPGGPWMYWSPAIREDARRAIQRDPSRQPGSGVVGDGEH